MLESTPNLRDIGGMVTDTGHTVAHHRVLRSAVPALGDIAPDGITWPPAVVIDLRSTGEVEEEHPLVPAGARLVTLPLLSALRPGAEPLEHLHGLYLLMVDNAAGHLVTLVREVAHAEGTTLIHCAAGKDRTGISIALLLRLVGVPRDAILADYLRTSDADQAIHARLSVSTGHERRATLPPAYFFVSAEAIDGVMDVWDEHDGGVHGWYERVGGSPDDVEHLRRTLLT